MISSLLLEAALRSVLLALAVWMTLRVFNVRNVPAQKAAWGLVLGAALVMPVVLPMAAHWSVLPANIRIALPADPQNLLEELQARIQAKRDPEFKPSEAAAPTGEGAAQAGQQAPLSVTETAGKSTAAPAVEDVEDQDFSNAGTVENVRSQAASDDAAMPQTAAVPHRAVVPQHAALSLSTIALLLYLGVAGVLLLRLVWGLMVALRLWRTATPISVDAPSSLAVALDLAGEGKVRCSANVASPVTICSSIVLPANYKTWDSEKLRIVLAHERSHIRQGDFYLQLLAGVYAAAVWFSPLGWWLKRKLSDLAEAISDRAGLEEAADRTSYAQILLEFAAAPRPTLIGVAMARSGSVSRRIDRLLNDVSFRQAFAGTRRAVAAVLVIPVALFAATALVRVEAAGQAAPNAPPEAPQAVVPPVAPVAPDAMVAPAAATPGVSTAAQISDDQDPAPAAIAPPPAAQEAPAAAAPAAPAASAPANLIVPPAAPSAPPSAVTIAPLSPLHSGMVLVAPKAPHAPGSASLVVLAPGGLGTHGMTMAIVGPRAGYGEGYGYGVGQSSTNESGSSNTNVNGKHSGYRYVYSSNGESYAIVRGDGHDVSFSGDWVEGHRDALEKARKMADGKDILWFTHDGKSYFVDDSATIQQIEAMYKPMEDLGRRQEELGKKQEALGKQQEELGRQQEAASVPTPDMSKEIAKIDEAMAKLKASQGKNMTQDQFADLQEKLGELQSRIGEIQGQIGEKQGEFGARMGELGGRMGALGSQMGELGALQGKIAQDADQRVRSIIDESMKNGKAHPVE